MYALKQFIKFLILPPGCWMVLLVAVLVFWKRRWARKLLLASVIVVFLFHSAIVASGLAWLLESRYKPLLDPRSVGDYDAIVTLTAGMTPAGGLIPFPRISEPQLHRHEETIRLYKLNPKPVIVSGRYSDPFAPPQDDNRLTCDYLVSMGVPREHVIAEAVSRDTFESALEVRKILKQRGWRRYLLVTSATHMPRSMLAFSKIAPAPIAAPGDFTVKRLVWSPLLFLPGEKQAGDIASVMNEFFGLINYRLRLLYDR